MHGREELRRTYKYSPEVDEDKHAQVEHPVHREEEGEEVVRQALRVAIERVERVRREGSGNCTKQTVNDIPPHNWEGTY